MKKRTAQAPRWLLAQEFLLESTGRISGVGLFLDDVVSLVMPSDAPDPIPEKQFRVSNLALLMSIPEFSGPHEFRVTLRSPLGEQKTSTFQTGDEGRPRTHNVVVNLNGFEIDSFGTYSVRAECASLNFDQSHEFQVRRQNLQLSEPAAEALTQTAAVQPKSRKRAATKKKPGR